MSEQELHSCVLCKEKFTDKETLQAHFRKHSDPDYNAALSESEVSSATAKPDLVCCDVCSEVFPTISKAITHKHKVHPDHDAKYFCYWCGSLFTLKHLFNKHLASHSSLMKSDVVLHCDSCNVDFYLNAAMLYHNKIYHRQDTDLPTIGHSIKQIMINQELLPVYYCAFCGEEYINKVNLHKHIGDDHGDENQSPDVVQRCPLCEAVFYHLDAYEIHLTFHTSDDIYNGQDNNVRRENIKEFTLDSVPPIIENVEEMEPNESVNISDLLQLTLTEDAGKKKKKHKKHKKSKKDAITLDEFLNMNADVFGEGLDIQGVEEVPTKIVKRLNVSKKPQPMKKVMKVPSSPELEKLKQQGIVIKSKSINQPRLAPGVKIQLEKSKIPVNKSNISTPVVKSSEINQISNKKPSNDEVLSKLLNQSKNQIVISKKPQNPAENQSNQVTTDSPVVDVVKTANGNAIKSNPQVNSEKEFEDECDDFADMSAGKNTSSDNDNDDEEKKIEDQEHDAPNNNASPKQDFNECDDSNERDTYLPKDDKIDDSNANIFKNISQSITIKSLSQNKPSNIVTNQAMRPSPEKVLDKEKDQEIKNRSQDVKNNIEPVKTDKVLKVGVNCQQVKNQPSLDLLKKIGHLTKKSPMQLLSKTGDEIDKESTDEKTNCSNNVKVSNEVKKKDDKTEAVLKKINSNIVIKSSKQDADREYSDMDDYDEEMNDSWHHSDGDSEEAEDAVLHKNELPAQTSIKALKNVPGITIKPTANKLLENTTNKMNAQDISNKLQLQNKHTNQINAINRQLMMKPVQRPPVSKVAPEKISDEHEIVTVDDSDSDDMENKEKNQVPSSASKVVAVQKPANATPKAQPSPLRMAKNITNVTNAHRTSSEHEDYDVDDDHPHDPEEEIQPNIINKPQVSNITEKLLQNKNISIKNMTVNVRKPESPNQQHIRQVNKPQSHQFVGKQVIKYKPREHDSDSEGDEFPEGTSNHCSDEDGPQAEDHDDEPKKDNDINQSLKNFEFDSDENQFSDYIDEETCGSESQHLIDKLKTINENLTIKSANQSNKPGNSSNSLNVSKNVIVKTANDQKRQIVQRTVSSKRESSQLSNENEEEYDDRDIDTTPNKVCKVDRNRVPYQNTNNMIGRGGERPTQVRQTNQQLSSANSVNQQVTTSVKTIQSETVVEEITTTVTRTIKTINREVSNQQVSSSNQSHVVNSSPQKIHGIRPQSTPLQGTKVQNFPVNRPRIRQGLSIRPNAKPVARAPNQVPQIRPIVVNQVRPANIRMANNIRPAMSANQIRSQRPMKITQNAQNAITKVNRPRPEAPGPFSCFKKPKESLIPLDSSDDDNPHLNQLKSPIPLGFTAKKTVVEMRSESCQQLSKLNTVSGLKIVKSSQSRQVVSKVEQCASSSANPTLAAIQRLQKQGLLVKKPRLEETQHDSESDEDDGGGGMLAIEGGS